MEGRQEEVLGNETETTARGGPKDPGEEDVPKEEVEVSLVTSGLGAMTV